MKTFAIGFIVSALSMPLSAQWLTQPTAGIPRTPDGKPNLAAAAPRTSDGKPDFTGIWTRVSRTVSADLKPIHPWVTTLQQERREDFGKDSMTALCLPLGPRYMTDRGIDLNITGMMKIIQTPGVIVMLNPDLTYRQIFMDGRALEADANPSWMGYSVGRWEGDTLVVESLGFNDRTWLENSLPHTEALRTIERYRRPDFGHLDLDVTLHDPALYAAPFTATLSAQLTADTELLEYVCNENTPSRDHWVGKLSDIQRSEVKISPDVLQQYVGTYVEQRPFWTGDVPRVAEITVAEDALFVIFVKTGAKMRLVAQSETIFAYGGLAIEFVKDSRGVPIHLLDVHVSGNYRFDRTK